MHIKRWLDAWSLVTLDLSAEWATELWLDESRVLDHQPGLRTLWSDAMRRDDRDHGFASLQRLLDGASPTLYADVSHWVSHVFQKEGADRSPEFVWAAAASGVIAAEPSLQGVLWRKSFERLHSTYRERSIELDRALDARLESDWDRRAAEMVGWDHESVVAKVGNICHSNLFAVTWERECASLTVADIEAASE